MRDEERGAKVRMNDEGKSVESVAKEAFAIFACFVVSLAESLNPEP